MSLFSDIVNSIGSDRSPAPPKPPKQPPGASSARPGLEVSKPVSRSGLSSTSPPLNGIKRKAEDGSPKTSEKHIKPNPAPGLTSTITKRTAAPPHYGPRPSGDHATAATKPRLETPGSIPRPSSTPSTPADPAIAKAPAKGSYADLMARAKQAQEMKMQNQVGLIKHQASNREKPSKVAERKRQEEERVKAVRHKAAARATTGKPDKSRSASPIKRTDHAKVVKVARPPLHAPASTYKGTMGATSGRKKAAAARNSSRADEYLGTDEEDNSDMDGYGDDQEDYESDASSDMEVGAFEVDEEEQRALRAAREEDAREQALESRLKKEKDDRRKKLLELAARRK